MFLLMVFTNLKGAFYLRLGDFKIVYEINMIRSFLFIFQQLGVGRVYINEINIKEQIVTKQKPYHP
jgi:hypothetical protein